MKRTTLNFLIEAALAAFVLITVTGILVRYVPPPGFCGFSIFQFMDWLDWKRLHFGLALVLFTMLVIHLAVHWKGILCMIRNKRCDATGVKAGLGIVGLVGLLTLVAVSFFFTPVERVAEPRQELRKPKKEIPEGVFHFDKDGTIIIQQYLHVFLILQYPLNYHPHRQP